MKYIYAGKEAEAWKFFNESEIDLSEPRTLSGKVERKEQMKEHIINDLNNDPIYKFIMADLKNKY